MQLGIASDHGGFPLKEPISQALRELSHTVTDFGASQRTPGDDYPDYVVPLARAVASGKIERGIAICGSGVGACVAVNKVPGARTALITDPYSAHQGVEDDAMNIICLGARVVGFELAWELIQIFLAARYTPIERFERRLKKVSDLEK